MAVKITAGVLREVWQGSAPLDGGATEVVTTGIRASATILSRVFGICVLQSVAGAPSITATPSIVNKRLVVTLVNSAAVGNSATWQLNVLLTHSIQQALDPSGLGCVYVIASNSSSNGAQAVKSTDVNVAGPYNVLASDYALEVRYTAIGAISINLPSIASCVNGRTIISIDSGGNAAANNITLVRSGGDKINNIAGNFVQTVNNSAVWLKANKTTSNWEII